MIETKFIILKLVLKFQDIPCPTFVWTFREFQKRQDYFDINVISLKLKNCILGTKELLSKPNG